MSGSGLSMLSFAASVAFVCFVSESCATTVHNYGYDIRRFIRRQLQKPNDQQLKSESFPRRGSVAILFRGGAFRKKHRGAAPCNAEAIPDQLHAADTIRKFVFDPIEALQNKLDLFVFTPPCNLTDMMIQHYGAHRVRAKAEINGFSQSDSMRKALGFIKSKTDVSQYDIIFILRHDLEFKSSIIQGSANWSSVNFLSGCERGSSGKHCVSDVLQSMPGKLFPQFDQIVGRGWCFGSACTYNGCRPGGQSDLGHGCRYELEIAGVPVGLITDWAPQGEFRRNRSNPIANVMFNISDMDEEEHASDVLLNGTDDTLAVAAMKVADLAGWPHSDAHVPHDNENPHADPNADVSMVHERVAKDMRLYREVTVETLGKVS